MVFMVRYLYKETGDMSMGACILHRIKKIKRIICDFLARNSDFVSHNCLQFQELRDKKNEQLPFLIFSYVF